MLTDVLEKTLNAYFQLNRQAPEALKQLAHKVVIMELTLPAFRCALQFTPAGVKMLSDDYPPADLLIKGTALAFMKAQMTKDPKHAAALQFIGDFSLVTPLNDIFDKAHVAWEEVFAGVFGDTLTDLGGRLWKKQQQWQQEATENALSNMKDYLQEETQCLPSQGEVDYFLSEVDRLRESVDRLIYRFKEKRVL